MKQSLLMSPCHIVPLVIVVAITFWAAPSRGADRADLERLQSLQRSIAASGCSPEAAVGLLKIHGLRDRLGDSKTTAAIKVAQNSAPGCRRTQALAQELSARLDIRAGRLEQAALSYQTRGFLADFLVAGPFDNDGGAAFEAELPPENLARSPVLDREAQMPGRSGAVSFRPLPKAAHAFGYNDLAALWDEPGSSCGYAVATLISKRQGRAVVYFGASGASAVWWNGRLVSRDSVTRRAFPDRIEAQVQVRAGANRALIKVCSEASPGLGFYLRVMDERGAPWPLNAAPSGVTPPLKVTPRSTAKSASLVDELLRRASMAKTSAKAASAAAWFLLLTGADDAKHHLGRDLAKRACQLEPSRDHCGALAALALDRSEQLWAMGSAAKAEPTANAYAAWARLELMAGHLDEAEDFVRQAKAISADSLDTKLLELELLERAGLTTTALEEARQLAVSHPEVPEVALLGWSMCDRTSQPVDTAAFARRAVSVAADELGPRLFLARRAAMEENVPELDQQISTLLKLDGASLATLTELAWLRLGVGQADVAVELLETAVDLAPQSFPARIELGRLLAAAGDRPRASQELRLAQAYRPQDADLDTYFSFYGPAEERLENQAIPTREFLAWRGGEEPAAGARLLVDQTVVEMLPSGLARRFRQLAVEVFTVSAARDWREHWIQSAASDQRVQVLAARVHHPDGSVSTGALTATVPVSEPWYRLYYDVEAQGIELPTLRPGDVVDISYRIDDVAAQNVLSDYFGDLVIIEADLPKTLWRYTVTTPASRQLYFNDPGLPSLKRHVEHASSLTTTTIFEAREVAAVTPESGMPGPSTVQRYLHVSTYRDYDALWTWYSNLVRPQAVPDDRIREAARQATAGLRDARAKTAAIYRWVVTNTRYVGLEFGIHGYKPYKAPLVVARGFGDCKDKANLLVTMLREVGIEAELALVRTRHRGDLDTSIASLAAFDHAIAYVPPLDLWLDGTAEQHGFEDLPFADQGVLSMRISKNGPVVGRTSIMKAERNRTTGDIELWLDESGDGRLNGKVSTTGETAAHLRRELETKHTRNERFEQLLRAAMPGAQLDSLTVSSLEALDAPVSYEYKGKVSSYARPGPDRTMEVPVDKGQEMVKRFARLPRRNTTLVVGPAGIIERRMRLHPPPGYEVSKWPEPIKHDTEFGSVELTATVTKGGIEIRRRVSLDVVEVKAQDYARFVDFCRAVDEALASSLILRRAP